MDSTAGRRVLSSAFYSSTVRRQTFDRLDLTSVVFGSGLLWLDRCTFVGADLRQATLDGCHFKMCDFTSAKLRGASARGAAFAGCDMRDADLRDLDLTYAEFSVVTSGSTNGYRTDVTGADLNGARMDHAVLEEVIGWPLR